MNAEKNKRLDEILESLDTVKKATAPDFFYSRLMARMEKTLPENNKRVWLLKPVYAVAILILILAINAVVFFSSKNDESASIVNENETLQQSIASEYSLADNNSIYDFNSDK